MSESLIYLDYNATTPVDPAVLDVMLPYLREKFGNPSCSHPYGSDAKKAVEEARKKVANAIGCFPEEIIFTSGGTESNNLAIFGVTEALKDQGRHIITSKIEHPAVIEPMVELIHRGFDVTFLPVDKNGLVDGGEIERLIRPDTILVSVMHANNETGVIQPIKEIATITRAKGVVFHSDAAQSFGKIEVNVRELGVDLLSIAGHKTYAPKGIGALYVRRDTPIKRVIFGAGQERGIRPGTEPVAQIVALGEAAEMASKTVGEEIARLEKLRNMLEEGILASTPNAVVHGKGAPRLPNTLSIGFPGMSSAELLGKMQNRIAASAGAACHGNEPKISHVLEAMGVSPEVALGTIRLSLGRFTTEEEIRAAIDYFAGLFS